MKKKKRSNLWGTDKRINTTIRDLKYSVKNSVSFMLKVYPERKQDILKAVRSAIDSLD